MYIIMCVYAMYVHRAYIDGEARVQRLSIRKLNSARDNSWTLKWREVDTVNVFMMSIVKSILCSAHINISIKIFMLITCQRAIHRLRW